MFEPLRFDCNFLILSWITFTQLSGVEERVPAQPVVLAMVVPPPAYEDTRMEQLENQGKAVTDV